MSEAMEEQQIVEGVAPAKRSRHRKKLLYCSIKDQMEFYFSDVNIGKDRFISQLVQNDPYIDLSVFLRFNKIRRLTDKISDLCRAVSKSEILELSEDNLKVRRKTEIQVKENEDECTIYVERLPVDAEHDWLKNIFSKFGPVDYVSIPRYKHNKMIKGFAFIEFGTPEVARNALKYFESLGCKLPTTMLPDKLASISSFEPEKSDKSHSILHQFPNEIEVKNEIERQTSDSDIEDTKKRKQIDISEESSENKKSKTETDNPKEIKEEQEVNEYKTGKNKKKDKRCKNKNEENYQEDETVEEMEAVNEIEMKQDDEFKIKKINKKHTQKRKLSDESQLNSETNQMKEELKSSNENNESETNVNEESNKKMNEEKTKVDNNISEEKRKRKRKKNKNNQDELQQYGFQVLSKKEWKQLRNKYLNLQRQKMQSLKEQLCKKRFNNTHNNIDEKNSSENKLSVVKTAPRFEFVPGVIVHITLRESFSDIKKFKNDIRSQPGLQYVDMIPGTNTGYIRFSDDSSAKNFCELENINADMAILAGNEEKEYWDKISQSREEKFKKEIKKQRGRDKLLRKAEKELGKHIRFDAE